MPFFSTAVKVTFTSIWEYKKTKQKESHKYMPKVTSIIYWMPWFTFTNTKLHIAILNSTIYWSITIIRLYWQILVSPNYMKIKLCSIPSVVHPWTWLQRYSINRNTHKSVIPGRWESSLTTSYTLHIHSMPLLCKNWNSS
jgi:hypothetical protein